MGQKPETQRNSRKYHRFATFPTILKKEKRKKERKKMAKRISDYSVSDIFQRADPLHSFGTSKTGV